LRFFAVHAIEQHQDVFDDHRQSVVASRDDNNVLCYNNDFAIRRQAVFFGLVDAENKALKIKKTLDELKEMKELESRINGSFDINSKE
jgi:hypothetical protein